MDDAIQTNLPDFGTKCLAHPTHRTDATPFFDEVVKQVKLNEQPLFAFVAPMRQHSPHEKGTKPDAKRCAPQLSDKQCSLMLDYNERLKLSVQAYKNLLKQLKQLPHRQAGTHASLFGAFCGFEDALPKNQAMLKRPQPPIP